MTRYIDADALIEKTKDPYRYCDYEYSMYADNFIEDINNAPTIDAVEVVRCKDCKHRFVDGENVKYNCCELNHNKYMADEWHCADGERKKP